MGIANYDPNNSPVIPSNYFCHFEVDLSSDPAKVDVTWYAEKSLSQGEYIDIVVNSTSKGEMNKDYFSD